MKKKDDGIDGIIKFKELIRLIIDILSYVFVGFNAEIIINKYICFLSKCNIQESYRFIAGTLGCGLLLPIIAEILSFIICKIISIIINNLVVKEKLSFMNHKISKIAISIGKFGIVLYFVNIGLCILSIIMGFNMSGIPILNNVIKSSREIASIVCNNVLNSDLMDYIGVYDVKYNGVYIRDAVTSSEDIDKKAIEITSGCKTDYEKAEVLYNWIGENIIYDDSLKDKLLIGGNESNSGAIYAYETRSGVCFEYATLYVAMAKAVNLPVRLIYGRANGANLLEYHAWNEVYIKDMKQWIKVDSTFWGLDGSFNGRNFDDTHEAIEILGEW